MTVEGVAAQLLCSASKISRMETGQRAASARDIRDLCGIYGVDDPSEQARLMSLARAAKERGWWQEYDLAGLETYVGLEDQATSITIFHSSIVPSLLQTADYARAVLKGTVPGISGGIANQRVEARIIRQRRLDEAQPPQFVALIDEAALHRRVGNVGIMVAQLAKILDVGKRPNVTVQVIPYEAGAHPGVDSTFCFLEFTDPPLPAIIYVEGLAGQIYLEHESDLARYRSSLEYLKTVAALDPDASANLINRIRAGFLKPNGDEPH
jgi:Domain of unknown function (DUF5753)/Helix-turn-helix domain